MIPHAGMDRSLMVALVVVAMVALIVDVDVLFLRDRFWARLAVNVGIVALFGAAYLAASRA